MTTTNDKTGVDVDYGVERFTSQDYIADDTKATDHYELPHYMETPFYMESGTKE